MIEIGTKENTPESANYTKVMLNGRPDAANMPKLPSANHRVVCGYIQYKEERLLVCDSLEEMQHLYDAYYRGGAVRINWYVADLSQTLTVTIL